jgi:hypothetical protein
VTPEEYRARGDHWLQAAEEAALAGDHDQARTSAAIAAPHFTAYAATYGAHTMDTWMAAAGPRQPDIGSDRMLAWLRQVNDGVFADGRPLSPEAAAAMRALEAAGLAVEGRPGYWSLTGRGREELVRAGQGGGSVPVGTHRTRRGSARTGPAVKGRSRVGAQLVGPPRLRHRLIHNAAAGTQHFVAPRCARCGTTLCSPQGDPRWEILEGEFVCWESCEPAPKQRPPLARWAR